LQLNVRSCVMGLDGRTARAMRTREAIVDASIALVAEGDVPPTAPRIAERAGVSVRSVFQHFDDLEGLDAAVADRLIQRLGCLNRSTDPSQPLQARLPDVVRQRSVLLEAITPIRRAAAVHAPFSREVRARMQRGHDLLRGEIERLFAIELDARCEAERTIMLDALDTVLSWPSWDNLRALNGRSIDEACAVMEAMVAALLVAGGEPPA
jgi:TetR/AcrR family transcriptional regulator, regulator of autoinduction and epiphytic fitness